MPRRSLYWPLLVAMLVCPALPLGAVEADGAHPGAFIQNSVISTQIRAKLTQSKIASLAHIQVQTENLGEVTLIGNVTSQEEAAQAIALAWSIAGVTRVNSLLVIP